MIASLHRSRTPFLALSIGCVLASAQSVSFELRAHPDSPVALATNNSPPWRAGADRRIFVAIANQSAKALAAVTFEQTISVGEKTRIVTLERSSIVMAPRQKRIVSVSVADILERMKSAATTGEKVADPALSVVAVEFLDGTLWSAP